MLASCLQLNGNLHGVRKKRLQSSIGGISYFKYICSPVTCSINSFSKNFQTLVLLKRKISMFNKHKCAKVDPKVASTPTKLNIHTYIFKNSTQIENWSKQTPPHFFRPFFLGLAFDTATLTLDDGLKSPVLKLKNKFY